MKNNFKFFNFRPFVFSLIAFAIGVLLAFSFFVSIWFLIGFCATVVCALVLIFVFVKREFIMLHLSKIVIVLLGFVLGICSFSISELVFLKKQMPAGNYDVVARVAEVDDDGTNKDYYTIYVDDVVLDFGSGKKKLGGGAKMFTYVKFEVGDKISFRGHYTPNKHDTFNFMSFDNYGKLSASGTISVADKRDLLVSDKIKNAGFRAFVSTGFENEGRTLYAMVFGDKSKLNETTKSTFQSVGLAHILAVSGLHIGFFVLMLSAFLDFCRVNKYAKFGILSVLLLVYCWLCGFSYSVLRASAMCIVMLYASLRSKQYDGLSALCFASILILTCDPSQMFSVSFLLSFFAVFSMFCLEKKIEFLLAKIYPSKFAGAFALSISTTIGVLPWMVYYFGCISTYSVPVNVVLIPVVSIIFMIAFALAPIACLFLGLSSILVLPKLMMRGVVVVCDAIAKLPGAVVEGNLDLWAVFVVVAAIVLCSDYVLLKGKTRIWLPVGVAATSMTLFLMNFAGVL